MHQRLVKSHGFEHMGGSSVVEVHAEPEEQATSVIPMTSASRRRRQS